MTKPARRPFHKMPDLPSIIAALVEDNLLASTEGIRALGLQQSVKQGKMHILEYLASLKLSNPRTHGDLLDLDTLSRWLAEQAGQPYVAIDPLAIDVQSVTAVMSHAYAQRHNILAIAVEKDHIVVASDHPWKSSWEDNLRHITRKSLQRVMVSPVALRRYIEELYSLSDSVKGALDQDAQGTVVNNFEQLLELGNTLSPDANDQHIVNLVDWLLQYAFEQRASDVHMEPRRENCHLRFRIDGQLHLIYKMPAAVSAAIISRIKILGRMNLAERRKPQDGRLKTRTPDGKETELRLSTLPTAFGEKLVMRIFNPDVLVKRLPDLGFTANNEQQWRSMVSQPYGIVIVTGPTGSGKTTTLYSTLKLLSTPEINVCTVEDPIEMIVPSFNQMQVHSDMDLTFASGLRALLRQDPDIIMVGEIRDTETADMAIQTALTGHQVISTMHTNDAPSAITRLMELGIAPYLIKSCLSGVMAQRLVRTLCPECKREKAITAEEWFSVFPTDTIIPPVSIFAATGCKHCRGTGYQGRIGLYEILSVTTDLQTLIHENTDSLHIRQQALKDGMIPLKTTGAQKVAAGITTLEEVLRVADSFY